MEIFSIMSHFIFSKWLSWTIFIFHSVGAHGISNDFLACLIACCVSDICLFTISQSFVRFAIKIVSVTPARVMLGYCSDWGIPKTKFLQRNRLGIGSGDIKNLLKEIKRLFSKVICEEFKSDLIPDSKLFTAFCNAFISFVIPFKVMFCALSSFSYIVRVLFIIPLNVDANELSWKGTRIALESLYKILPAYFVCARWISKFGS